MTEPILTPEQELRKRIEEKRQRVALEIQTIMDKEGMEFKVAQTIIVVPKQ
jgi:hypothetical protein